VVLGPEPFGPIKKLKNPIEVTTNKNTKPTIAIDSHSPDFNIPYNLKIKNTVF
jgi:hypothetical protein